MEIMKENGTLYYKQCKVMLSFYFPMYVIDSNKFANTWS